LSDADVTITALRSTHDELATVVRELSDDELAGPSAATEWTVADVLSHLGSGAEIARATLRAALDGEPNPGQSFNLSVWDRWNALGGREQAEGFLASNEELTALYESLPAQTRRDLRIDMGFLPAPIDVAAAAGLRLNELALHSWDVRAGLDETATLEPGAVAALLPGPALILGWIGKPEHAKGPADVVVTTTGPDSTFTLRLTESVSLHDSSDAGDATLNLPGEAWLRLISGRLGPRYTPAGVTADGSVDLDTLRAVFPGF